MDCIFCRIANKEIPAQLQYEDEHVVAFNDIHPVAPTHILIIPKQHIEEFYKAPDDMIFASIGKAIKQLIADKQLSDKGYRLEVNGGGAQLVNHLHFHLLAPVGKPQG